jgi:hypothetical protein
MSPFRRQLFPLLLVLPLGVVLLLPGARSQAPGAESSIAPWQTKDIGKPALAGTVRRNPAQYWVVQAANGDIGTLPKKLDNFFLIYQPLTGDGSILALLLGQEGGSPQWSKAGVMFRESLAPGARNVLLGMATGPGPTISYRAATNKSTILAGAGSRFGSKRFPLWLRLQREGEAFTPFSSTDGFGWSQLSSSILLPRFAASALAGLATSSYESGTTTAIYGSATIAPGLVSPLVRVISGNGRVLLAWFPVSGAAGYVVRRSRPQSPSFAGDTLTPQPIRETSYLDTGLPNGQIVRYLVSAVFEQGGHGGGPVRSVGRADRSSHRCRSLPLAPKRGGCPPCAPPRRHWSEAREGGGTEGWPTAVLAQPFLVPGELSGCDINLEATQLRGSIEYDLAGGRYKITGSGGDVGGAADRCYFASRFLTGDFQVTVRIDGPPSRGGAKAGLMVRETLEGPSRMLYLARAAGTGVLLQTRREPGGNAREGSPVIAEKKIRTSLYLRLVRELGRISASVSTDGVSFTRAGAPQTLGPSLPDGLHVGYAITSRDPGGFASHTFTQLQLTVDG